MTLPLDIDALRKLCEEIRSRIRDARLFGTLVAINPNSAETILDELDRLRAAEVASKARVEASQRADGSACIGKSIMTPPHPFGTDALRKLHAEAPCCQSSSLNISDAVRDFYEAARKAIPAWSDELDRLRAAEAAGKARVEEAEKAARQKALVEAAAEADWLHEKGAARHMYIRRILALNERPLGSAARAEIARLTDAGAGKCVAKTNESFPADCKLGMSERCPICEPVPPPPAAADRGVPGQRVTHIRQSDPYGCLLASVAMVTGQTYEEVRKDIGYAGKGFTYHTWQEYLGRAGYAYQMFFRCDPFTNKDRSEWPLPTWADLHLCTVDAGQGDGSHVVVLLRDGTVLDPARSEPSRLCDYPGTPVYMAAVYPRAALATAPKAEDVRREAVEGVADAIQRELQSISEGDVAFNSYGQGRRTGFEEAERLVRALADRLA